MTHEHLSIAEFDDALRNLPRRKDFGAGSVRGTAARLTGEANMDPIRNNWLLAAMDPESVGALRPYLERTSLSRADTLFDIDMPLTRIWFPTSCVVSLIVQMENGSSAQVAAIGREGAVGHDALFGTDRALVRGTVQVPGGAYFIEKRKFLPLVERSAAMRAMVWRSLAVVYAEAMRSAACYALHPARARLARFLLTTQDRTGTASVSLTQELLAEMLGVQRTTVTAAALGLTADGCISYRRGHIRICDRAGLERAACECYLATRQLFAPAAHGRPVSRHRHQGSEGNGFNGCSAH
ncbi:MAG TPA: Crp/Fnr family transcriptional regulator [Woeseiaceae bacterium]|nr:Crp/Fnr family transcriptional regulator [Woeseiaceae bacterium]